MASLELNRYIYDGPVTVFDKCVVNNWHCETVACSLKKAASNMRYQFNKAYNHTPNSQVYIDIRKIVKKELE